MPQQSGDDVLCGPPTEEFISNKDTGGRDPPVSTGPRPPVGGGGSSAVRITERFMLREPLSKLTVNEYDPMEVF